MIHARSNGQPIRERVHCHILSFSIPYHSLLQNLHHQSYLSSSLNVYQSIGIYQTLQHIHSHSTQSHLWHIHRANFSSSTLPIPSVSLSCESSLQSSTPRSRLTSFFYILSSLILLLSQLPFRLPFLNHYSPLLSFFPPYIMSFMGFHFQMMSSIFPDIYSIYSSYCNYNDVFSTPSKYLLILSTIVINLQYQSVDTKQHHSERRVEVMETTQNSQS